ncbi:hypothetical protein [Roseivirga sp. E12]|uniref:hypothetical protein n=1 Tax=Roseivirga sp. E12 TaxID=2819237 RepID=UPI001ABC2EDC|nr:hypothetical protein [Roseivirga sp. E12]MBO3697295.1 hypothetical protein [Roseivirga sp. E12]
MKKTNLYYLLVFCFIIFSCGSEDEDPTPQPQTKCSVESIVFPAEGAFGLNILGTEGQNITIDAGTSLSLSATLAESCQRLKVTIETQGSSITGLDWDFDVSSVSNWFWDLDQTTGIQEWTSRGNNLDAHFKAFLPGTYDIKVYINGSSTPSSEFTVTTEYENVDFLNTFSSATSMFREGNDLYVSTDEEVLKLDINDPSEATTIVSGLSNIWKVVKHGDYIYITERTQIPGIDTKLSRVNVTDASPSVEFMLDGLTIGGMAARNNVLYLTDLRKTDVVSIDLTANSFSIVDLGVSGLESPINMTLGGDVLYISEESSTAKITQIDLSQGTPQVSTLKSDLFFPDEMHVAGTTLYYSTAGSIYKLDISQANPPAELVRKLSTMTFTQGIDIYNNELYFLESPLNRLAKFDLD